LLLSCVSTALQNLQLIGKPVAYPHYIYNTNKGNLIILVVLGIKYFLYSSLRFPKFGIYAFFATEHYAPIILIFKILLQIKLSYY